MFCDIIDYVLLFNFLSLYKTKEKLTMDFFTEVIIKQKKSPLVYLATLGMILATLVVWAFSLTLMGVPALSGIVGLLDVGIVYLSYYVISGFNIEYEYIATNTDIDIDKIVNRRKRKRIISLRLSEIDTLAPIENDRNNSGETKVINAARSKNDPDAYYIITSKNGQKTKIIFNPNEKMIENAKRFYPERVIIR